MALSYGFYDAEKNDRIYQAEQVSETFNGVITQGIFPYIYVNGDKKDYHFDVTPGDGLKIIVGPGKAYICNLWIYNDADTTLELTADASNPRYAVVYLVINTQVIYTSNIDIKINEGITLEIKLGDAAATPALPTVTGDYIWYIPIAYIKIPAGATKIETDNIKSAIGSASLTFDSKTVTGITYASSEIGTIDLSKISDEEQDGNWGSTNGVYDLKKQGIEKEYEGWISKDIKEANFKDNSAGVVADYFSRVTSMKKNKNKNYVIIYIKSLRKNLSGKNVTLHNNSYPQHEDVTATFSISDTTPETTVILQHIGNYTITESLKGTEFEIDIPYFGEYYKDIEILYGEGDMFGFRFSLTSMEVEYVQNYVLDANYLCANYEYQPTKIDWTKELASGGYGLDDNFLECWKGAFFLPKPVIIDKDGTELYNLDEDNYKIMIDKKTGKRSDIFTTDEMIEKGYNVMMAFPRVYVHRFIKDGYGYCYISQERINNNFNCYAHIDYEGNVIDYFYRSVYIASLHNNTLRSISGTTPYEFWPDWPRNSAALFNNGQAWARNNYKDDDGNVVPIWNLEGISDLNLIKDYVVLLTKSFKTQDTLGATTFKTSPFVNGLMDDKGQTFSNGQLALTNVRTYNSRKYNNTTATVQWQQERYCKFLGMERFFSEHVRMCLGIFLTLPANIYNISYNDLKKYGAYTVSSPVMNETLKYSGIDLRSYVSGTSLNKFFIKNTHSMVNDNGTQNDYTNRNDWEAGFNRDDWSKYVSTPSCSLMFKNFLGLGYGTSTFYSIGSTYLSYPLGFDNAGSIGWSYPSPYNSRVELTKGNTAANVKFSSRNNYINMSGSYFSYIDGRGDQTIYDNFLGYFLIPNPYYIMNMGYSDIGYRNGSIYNYANQVFKPLDSMPQNRKPYDCNVLVAGAAIMQPSHNANKNGADTGEVYDPYNNIYSALPTAYNNYNIFNYYAANSLLAYTSTYTEAKKSGKYYTTTGRKIETRYTNGWNGRVKYLAAITCRPKLKKGE